jgi:hypothetical protein
MYLGLPLTLGRPDRWFPAAAGHRRSQPGFDIPGVLTVSCGLVALVYGLSEAASCGWGDPVTATSLAIAVVALIAFTLLEQRVSHSAAACLSSAREYWG